MASFRILPPLATYFNQQGEILAGGRLDFFTGGTLTPENVYGDRDLAVNNGVSLALDASGRPGVDIWGDSAITYRVRMYDSDGVLQDEADYIEAQGQDALPIPSLVLGEFLSNNGVSLDWEAVRQVPDPSGQADKVLGTDGANVYWINKPADGAAGTPGTSDITATSNSVKLNNVLIQWGSGTVSASGSTSASTNVNFPIGYDTIGHVGVMAKTVNAGSAPAPVVANVTSASVSSFTVIFDIAEGNSNHAQVINSIPYSWIAIGVKA